MRPLQIAAIVISLAVPQPVPPPHSPPTVRAPSTQAHELARRAAHLTNIPLARGVSLRPSLTSHKAAIRISLKF